MDPATLNMLASSMGDMSQEDIEKMIRQQKEAFDREGREERIRAKDPLAPGRWVTLSGLQAEGLNGRIAEVIRGPNSAGRLGVRVQGQGDKLVKAENLRAFAEDSVVKVARIGARGEEVAPDGPGGVRTWHWPRCVLEEWPSEASTISELIGIPLRITKVEAHKNLSCHDDFDNYFGTSLMASPATGLAPLHWQACGPVIAWRSGGEHFSADDAVLVVGFLRSLEAKYPDLDVEGAITPSAFQEFKLLKLEQERLNPLGEQSEDVNV